MSTAEAIDALAKALATTIADQEEETGHGITADQINRVADAVDRLAGFERGTPPTTGTHPTEVET